MFVSRTGRGLTGDDADLEVRLSLIAESQKPSMAPRLLSTSAGIVEAVPLGDDHVQGWILTPAEPSGNPKTRSLLLSTAVALLGVNLADASGKRRDSRLFTTPLEAADARREWAQATGLAPVATTRMRIFDGVRGEAPESLIADLGEGVPLIRAGSILGVVGADSPAQGELINRVAETTGVELVAERTLTLSRIHHAWTQWRSQHEPASSDARALLSSIDESVAARFIERVLGDLLAARGGQELMATLRAFISAGGVREQVAVALGVHRHTVRARMGKIERILGRDLSQSESVHAVATALELAELSTH